VVSPGNQEPRDRASHWLAVARTLIVEILVLLALSGAAIAYLDWSSDVNWAAFIAASQTAGLVLTHPRPDASVQTAKGQAPCRPGD
jgi:hypothetical protein